MECNLSDEEVEEDYTDWEKHLDMEKSDCEPKALQQGSLKVGIKGDMSREEASMDNTECWVSSRGRRTSTWRLSRARMEIQCHFCV